MNVKIPMPNIGGLSSLLALAKDNLLVIAIAIGVFLYFFVFNKKKGGGGARPAPKPSGGGGGGVSGGAFIRIFIIGLILIFGCAILGYLNPELADKTNRLMVP